MELVRYNNKIWGIDTDFNDDIKSISIKDFMQMRDWEIIENLAVAHDMLIERVRVIRTRASDENGKAVWVLWEDYLNFNDIVKITDDYILIKNKSSGEERGVYKDEIGIIDITRIL